MSGKVVGLVNLGDINEHLIKLEQLLPNVHPTPTWASYATFLASYRVVTSWLPFEAIFCIKQLDSGWQVRCSVANQEQAIWLACSNRCHWSQTQAAKPMCSWSWDLFRPSTPPRNSVQLPSKSSEDSLGIDIISLRNKLMCILSTCIVCIIQKGSQQRSWKLVEDHYIIGSRSQGLTTTQAQVWACLLDVFLKDKCWFTCTGFKGFACLWTGVTLLYFRSWVILWQKESILWRWCRRQQYSLRRLISSLMLWM